MTSGVELVRLRPRNFAIVPESLASHLKKERYIDICITNGSKVLIYLTSLFFLLHYLHEYSKF